jgi:hypothetical protein
METKQMQPLLVSKAVAGQMLGGRSQSTIKDMIARGELEAVKDGKRLFITVASINAYVASLPSTTLKLSSRGAPPKLKRHK